jgi:hypothetical protein
VDTEQQSIQSNRAAEQSAAEQSAGLMTRALLSRDGLCTSAQTSVWALSHRHADGQGGLLSFWRCFAQPDRQLQALVLTWDVS